MAEEEEEEEVGGCLHSRSGHGGAGSTHTHTREAPPAILTVSASVLPHRLPEREGRDAEGRAAVILAVRRIPGVELRRRPGREGTGEGPAAAADGAVRSPSRESDAGVVSSRHGMIFGPALHRHGPS